MTAQPSPPIIGDAIRSSDVDGVQLPPRVRVATILIGDLNASAEPGREIHPALDRAFDAMGYIAGVKVTPSKAGPVVTLYRVRPDLVALDGPDLALAEPAPVEPPPPPPKVSVWRPWIGPGGAFEPKEPPPSQWIAVKVARQVGFSMPHVEHVAVPARYDAATRSFTGPGGMTVSLVLAWAPLPGVDD